MQVPPPPPPISWHLCSGYCRNAIFPLHFRKRKYRFWIVLPRGRNVKSFREPKLFQNFRLRGGGHSHQNRTWMCLSNVKNLISHPDQYTIFETKAPNVCQIGFFLQLFTQSTRNLCNLGSLGSDDPPPLITILNFAKKRQKAGTYVYHVNLRIPRLLAGFQYCDCISACGSVGSGLYSREVEM